MSAWAQTVASETLLRVGQVAQAMELLGSADAGEYPSVGAHKELLRAVAERLNNDFQWKDRLAALASRDDKTPETSVARFATSSDARPSSALCAAMTRRLGLKEPAELRAIRSDQPKELHVGASQCANWDRTDRTPVIDLAARRARIGGAEIDLHRRAATVDMLSALLRTPGSVVSVDELAARAWGVEFHSERHHSRPTMAISRLRRELGLRIDAVENGYRVLLPEPWLVLHPAD